MENRQTAPEGSADALASVVERITYKPGWRIWLSDKERPTEQYAGSSGLTLCIGAAVVDSTQSGASIGAPVKQHTTVEHTTVEHTTTTVEHWFAVPPLAYDEPTWQRWILDRILDVETHEAMEFFRVDGDTVYLPAHGPLRNPYTIERTTQRLAPPQAVRCGVIVLPRPALPGTADPTVAPPERRRH